MKRKWYLENIQINTSGFKPKDSNSTLTITLGKRIKTIGEELGAFKVTNEISLLIDGIINNNMVMEIDTVGKVWNKFKFIFFLGVQGKEYIEDIRRKIPFLLQFICIHFFKHFIYRSSTGKCSQNDDCITLSSYFKVLDPLGGGIYPLDYLVIIDQENYILRKVPIKVNKFTRFVLKHSITIDDLHSLIDKYLKSSMDH